MNTGRTKGKFGLRYPNLVKSGLGEEPLLETYALLGVQTTDDDLCFFH